MGSFDRENILDSIIYVKKEMPEVLYREEILDGERVAVLFDAVKKEMYHLKGNSDKIWRLIDGKRTLRKIAGELMEISMDDAEEQAVIKDVIKFLVKLGRLDLIKFAYKCKTEKEMGYAAVE